MRPQYTAAASLFPDLLLDPETMTGAISERSASSWMSARGVVLVPVYLSLLPGRSGCQIPMVSCLPGSEGTLHCLYDPWKPRGESSRILQRFKDLNPQNITYKTNKIPQGEEGCSCMPKAERISQSLCGLYQTVNTFFITAASFFT